MIKPSTTPAREPKILELSDEQLSLVSGGKHNIAKASPVLMKSCVTGEHIKEAKII